MNTSKDRFRKHVRLHGFDYRSNQAYFVTVVTARRECVFGSIEAGAAKLSQFGLIVTDCWHDIANHHSFVELDEFIVMPNHIHGILMFVGNDEEATQASPLQAPGIVTTAPGHVAATPASPNRARGPASHSLGAVVGSFKAAASRQINRIHPGAVSRLWQPNFYEHIIRHDMALDAMRDYILTNPDRWNRDAENPHGDMTDDLGKFLRLLEIRPLPKSGDAGVAATKGAK